MDDNNLNDDYNLNSRNFLDEIIEYQNKGMKLPKKLKKPFFEMIKKIEFFNNILSIYNKKKINDFLDELKIKKYNQTEYIYHEDSKINFIYVLINGVLEVKKNDKEIQKIKEFGFIFNYNALKNVKNCEETIFVFKDSCLIEIDYLTFIQYDKGLKNKDLSKFIIELLKFEFFKEIDLNLKDFQKIVQFFHLISFKKGDIVFKENDIIDENKDGIYFILNGEFLISKNKKKEKSIFTKLKKIDFELNKLKKESEILLEKIRTKQNIIFRKNQPNYFLTKDNKKTTNLIYLTENNIFGEIEYAIKAKIHPYNIICQLDNSNTLFISYHDFNIIENKIIHEVLLKYSNQKRKILSENFYNNHFVNKKKIFVKDYSPLDDLKSQSLNKNNNYNDNNNNKFNYIYRNSFYFEEKIDNTVKLLSNLNFKKSESSNHLRIFNISQSPRNNYNNNIKNYNSNNNSINISNNNNKNETKVFFTTNESLGTKMMKEDSQILFKKRINRNVLLKNIENKNNKRNSFSLRNNTNNNLKKNLSTLSNYYYYLKTGIKMLPLNIKSKYPNLTFRLSKNKENIKSLILKKSPRHINLYIQN